MATPLQEVARLDAAIGEVNKELRKVRAGKAADQFSRSTRLELAKAAIVTVRDAYLAQSDAGSAGNDSTMRMVAGKESAASGYQAAVAGIAKLQKNKR